MRNRISVILIIFYLGFIVLGISSFLPGADSFKENAYRFFTSADSGAGQIVTAVRTVILRLFILAVVFSAGVYFAELLFNTVKKQKFFFSVNTILIKLRI